MATAGLRQSSHRLLLESYVKIAMAMRAGVDFRRAAQAADHARRMRDTPWEAAAAPKPTLEQMVAAAGELTEPSSALVAYAMINEAYPEYAEAWRERGAIRIRRREASSRPSPKAPI